MATGWVYGPALLFWVERTSPGVFVPCGPDTHLSQRSVFSWGKGAGFRKKLQMGWKRFKPFGRRSCIRGYLLFFYL